jgi:Family of unknown function (DUF6505)
MHKLLRAIRLDASDTFVFDRAASANEWVVSGSFLFWDQQVSSLTGRGKSAFRSGMLGLGTFGWTTLAVVVEATDEEREAALHSLATYLMVEQGAPTMEAARAAAEDEIAFAVSLAQHPVQTLVAVHRTLTADGEISEQFRTFHAADAKQATAQPCSAGAFAVVEDGEDEHPSDHFDLAGAVSAGQVADRNRSKP